MKILLFAFFCVLIVASYQDIKKMEIKDGCHITITVLAVAAIFSGSEPVILSRFSGALCISTPMLVLCILFPGAFGGGDIKLMAAGGLFLGWRDILVSAVIALFAAGGYVLVLLVKKKMDRRQCFAFGPFLCAGMMIGALWGKRLWRLWIGW